MSIMSMYCLFNNFKTFFDSTKETKGCRTLNEFSMKNIKIGNKTTFLKSKNQHKLFATLFYDQCHTNKFKNIYTGICKYCNKFKKKQSKKSLK